MRAAQERVYAADSLTGALIASSAGGRAWQERTVPAPVFDLALEPGDPERLLAAATERGLFGSGDGGRTWRPLRDDLAGLLAWPGEKALYLVDGDGAVLRSRDGGRNFEPVGSLGARPEAFAAHRNSLYAGLQGGEVVMSGDRGASWRTRAQL